MEDPGFLRRERQGWVTTYYLAKFSHENCVKMKDIGPKNEAFGSANDQKLQKLHECILNLFYCLLSEMVTLYSKFQWCFYTSMLLCSQGYADRTPNNWNEIIRHTPTVRQTYAKLSSISYYEVITR